LLIHRERQSDRRIVHRVTHRAVRKVDWMAIVTVPVWCSHKARSAILLMLPISTVFEWTKKQMIPRRHRDVCLHVWERATAADPLTETQKRLTARLADGESSSYYTWYCATCELAKHPTYLCPHLSLIHHSVARREEKDVESMCDLKAEYSEW